MTDKYYPRDVFETDLKKVREMSIPPDLKILKGQALAYLYLNQEKEWQFDHMAIADYRENILKEAIE
jgi:hypothetical protein